MLKRMQMAIVYVDDNQMVGDVEATDDPIVAVKENRIMNGLQNYLSCKIKFSTDEKSAWSGQSHLLQNLAKTIDEIFAVIKLQIEIQFS